ncbi:uncharacterized protein LOC121792807 [Salvia splendens]|uniref:uncharacterized protein LOC121792807 n=1 Tax=Salvia splendens TaxID=180675 RepID=UPI001C27DA19|nr:uncharacterized protein LOC121792807 [Salvia splendens]
MRGALLRNLSLYTRSRHFSLYHRPTAIVSNACTTLHRKLVATDNAQHFNHFPSIMRFFSSEDGTQDPDANPESESPVALPEEKITAAVEVGDVDNKELKAQVEDYLQNANEEAIPKVFESILKRRLSDKHEETDDEFLDELCRAPIDNVADEDFESDLEDALETDDEIDDLCNARDYVMEKRSSDPFFNMTDQKWNEMIKEATERGHLQDTKECEDLLEDMLNWDKLLPDKIKKKVEVKFNEIADRIEKGEINDEEGYEIFKEFEDQMVLECMKEKEPPQFDNDSDKSMNCEMRVRLTWFAGSGAAQQECEFRYSQQFVLPQFNVNPPLYKDGQQGRGAILRWRSRVVLSPGGDSWHPKNRKVKLSVTVKELGLSKHQLVRLRELVGKRYNPGKDELMITSERFEHREENRKDCLRTLYALIEEAGKAKEMVHEARVSDMKERLKANPDFMLRLLSKKKASATNLEIAS